MQSSQLLYPSNTSKCIKDSLAARPVDTFLTAQLHIGGLERKIDGYQIMPSSEVFESVYRFVSASFNAGGSLVTAPEDIAGESEANMSDLESVGFPNDIEPGAHFEIVAEWDG